MSCDAKVRPFTDQTELTCENGSHGLETNHRAVLRDYAWPGSRTEITWLEGDRRNYHGKWPGPCGDNDAPCTLPAGHRGRHAP